MKPSDVKRRICASKAQVAELDRLYAEINATALVQANWHELARKALAIGLVELRASLKAQVPQQ